MPIQGASEKWAGRFYDKGGAVFNVEHPDFGSSLDAAGLRIKAALAALPDDGGVVDARGLRGAQTIAVDVFDGITTKPITLLMGSATFTVSALQRPSSHVTILLFGTTIVAATETTTLFFPRTAGGVGAVTNGSADITPPANVLAECDEGDVVAIFGHVPRGGRDNNQLNGAIDGAVTTITVDSTTGFPSAGYLRIDSELIQYTGTSATTFTGCTRGYGGSTAASHLDNAVVDRCVYEQYAVLSKSGATVTLDATVSAPTATALDMFVGSQCVTFDGYGLIDGAKDGETDPGGAQALAIDAYFVRWLTTGANVRFENWDHGGVRVQVARDCTIDGRFRNNGRTASSLGGDVWLYTNSQRCRVFGEYDDSYECIKIDDRTTTATLYDNDSTDNYIHPRSIRGASKGIVHSSGSRNCMIVPHAIGVTSAVVQLDAPQWVTAPTPRDNYVEVLTTDDASVAVSMTAQYVDGGNTIIARARGLRLSSTQTGNAFEGPRGLVAGGPGTALTPNLAHGDYFKYTMNGATSVAIASNGYYGAVLTIDLVNPTGGALNATFNAVYLTSFAGTLAVAAGKRRSVTFRNDGSNYVQVGDVSADL